MVDSLGRPFQSREFAGKVSIVDFIYTNCPAECPMMSSRMHKIEQRVRGDSDVRLVSISVDPERDVPQVLNAFAHRYGAPTDQWTFLTGTPATVHLVAYDTFHVGDVLGRIEHSTKFVVVDKREHIRGYYSSFDQDDLKQMIQDVNALRRQRS
jgi:protein SCO1/2